MIFIIRLRFLIRILVLAPNLDEYWLVFTGFIKETQVWYELHTFLFYGALRVVLFQVESLSLMREAPILISPTKYARR